MKYNKSKYNNDIQFKLSKIYRNRFNKALNKYYEKGISQSIDYLGCTITEFVNYIKKKFTKGMTIEKLMNGEIHIDHIRPLSSYDLTQELEIKKAFHYSNCQPLWAKENLSKGASVPDVGIQMRIL